MGRVSVKCLSLLVGVFLLAGSASSNALAAIDHQATGGHSDPIDVMRHNEHEMTARNRDNHRPQGRPHNTVVHSQSDGTVIHSQSDALAVQQSAPSAEGFSGSDIMTKSTDNRPIKTSLLTIDGSEYINNSADLIFGGTKLSYDGPGGVQTATAETKRLDNRPSFTTQFTRDGVTFTQADGNRKESIDCRNSRGCGGKLHVGARPDGDNDGQRVALGTPGEEKKFTERPYIWRVHENLASGYGGYGLPLSPEQKLESIFVPHLQGRFHTGYLSRFATRTRSRSWEVSSVDRSKADHPASSQYSQGHSPGGSTISPLGGVSVAFSEARIEGNSKHVIGMNLAEVSTESSARKLIPHVHSDTLFTDVHSGMLTTDVHSDTWTTDARSPPKSPAPGRPMDNDFSGGERGPGAPEVLHYRARRDVGNYTVGSDSNTSNDTSNNSTIDVATVMENNADTPSPTQPSQKPEGATQTVDVDGGSGDGGSVVFQTNSDNSQATSQSAGSVSSTLKSDTSQTLPQSTTGSPSSTKTETTTMKDRTVETSTTSATPQTTALTRPTTLIAKPSTHTSMSSPPPPTAAPQTTVLKTSPTPAVRTEPTSGKTLLVQPGTAVGTTAFEQTSANVAEANKVDDTQNPDVTVGKTVGYEGTSDNPVDQASSVGTLTVTQNAVPQISITSVTSSTDPGSGSTKNDASTAGQTDTSTKRVVRSSEPTAAPASTDTDSPTSTVETTPQVTTQVTTEVKTEVKTEVTTEESVVMPDTGTTVALTSKPTTVGEEEGAQPEGGSYPEPGGGGKKGTGLTKDEEAQGEGSSEPGPDWSEAKMAWGELWDLHLYVFGCLFGLLGVYTLVCVIRLWSIHRLMSRRYFVSLNLLMLLLCSTRSVYLLLDGYNAKQTFHQSLDYFLYSISFPCLSSAFSIQLYALLQATKMQFLPPTIQKMSMLIIVTAFHFAISIATDVVVGMYAGMQIMLLVCQLFFILWGLFLFFGYAYIFRRLYLHAVKRQKNVVQKSSGSYSTSGSTFKQMSKFTLSVAVKVTFSTAVLGLVTVGLEVYGMVGVYKNFSPARPQPWPWYIYHTTLRLIEFLMCATMSYVASQPFRYRRRRQCCCCPVLCAPCAEICCCGSDINRSNSLAGWSDIDQHQMRASFDRGNAQHVSLQHEGVGNGHMNGGGDMTAVAAKTRIYFKDRADVMPILTSQPTSLSDSRPTSAMSDFVDESTMSTRGSRGSMTGSIDGTAAYCNPYRSVPSPTDSKRFFPPSYRQGMMASTPVKARDGVVNTAYTSTDDPQSPGFASSKSRNGSIASSEYFHAPSVSLADSMASELDKAFRSMHEDQPPEPATRMPSKTPSNAHAVSTPSLPSLDETLEREAGGRAGAGAVGGRREFSPQEVCSTFPESSIQRFLQQQNGDMPVGLVLRRSRSAIGRCSFQEVEPLQGRARAETGVEGRGGDHLDGAGAHLWHMKLFRSRSDNTGGIRTKDVDNARYMLLPDLERSDQLDRPSSHAQAARGRTDRSSLSGGGTSSSAVDSPTSGSRVYMRSVSSDSTAHTDSPTHGRSAPSDSFMRTRSPAVSADEALRGSASGSDKDSRAPTSLTNSNYKTKSPSSTTKGGRGLHTCLGNTTPVTHSVSPGFMHSGNGRLKYRDDESDDIEV